MQEQSKKKVLIVDADKTRLAALRFIVERGGGHDVTPVVGGKIAKQALEKNRFDAVIAYQQLGEPDGASLLGYAKTKNPDVQTLLLVISKNTEVMKMARHVGVDIVFTNDERLVALQAAKLVPQAPAEPLPPFRIAKQGEVIVKG